MVHPAPALRRDGADPTEAPVSCMRWLGRNVLASLSSCPLDGALREFLPNRAQETLSLWASLNVRRETRLSGQQTDQPRLCLFKRQLFCLELGNHQNEGVIRRNAPGLCIRRLRVGRLTAVSCGSGLRFFPCRLRRLAGKRQEPEHDS